MPFISFKKAIHCLQSGKVIAIPTDTVYGIAAHIEHADAVRSIFELKKRPQNKPLIILCSHFSQISSFISAFPPSFEKLQRFFWPGALTVILPIMENAIHNSIHLDFSTTGFRIPNHPLLLKILQQVGPLAVTSANLSGETSAKNAKEVLLQFGQDFPVLEGDRFVMGTESTIINYVDNAWKILRSGTITTDQLKKVVSISTF